MNNLAKSQATATGAIFTAVGGLIFAKSGSAGIKKGRITGLN
ncbi:hypothetical protein AEST_32210 [Alishewanella aestuarii B11]|uniref:Uncharacterized protein n=1 Tax=Alishewanella aestuarii B11 TaxID=1197174 RepID=J1Y8G0_9ALTE|nr:hypothetical protein AEST_32210 [Alishewanella aestuarii B11]